MIYRKVVIAETERGLVFKDKRIVRLLEPGVYRLTIWGARLRIVNAAEAESNPAHGKTSLIAGFTSLSALKVAGSR